MIGLVTLSVFLLFDEFLNFAINSSKDKKLDNSRPITADLIAVIQKTESTFSESAKNKLINELKVIDQLSQLISSRQKPITPPDELNSWIGSKTNACCVKMFDGDRAILAILFQLGESLKEKVKEKSITIIKPTKQNQKYVKVLGKKEGYFGDFRDLFLYELKDNILLHLELLQYLDNKKTSPTKFMSNNKSFDKIETEIYLVLKEIRLRLKKISTIK